MNYELRTMNKKGVTLIELLMVLIISAIAMFPLALPFIADRAFWGSGKAQAESQRDAQMVMRAIASFARESKSYPIIGSAFSPGPGYGRIQFIKPDSTQMCFEGGPSHTYQGKSGAFTMGPQCVVGGSGLGTTAVLIDGNRSKVTNTSNPPTGFTIVPITSKQVRVRLEVTHEPIVGSGRQEKEVLETEIFLRNGT